MVFGAGRMGTTIASVLYDRGLRVRVVDAQRERVAEIAETLPKVRAFHADVFDPEFLERERIGRARAGVFCLNDDAKNLYGAVLAKEHGLDLTIALVHDHTSVAVYARGGIDVDRQPAPGQRREEMVRFAHDPRIRQIAMLEDDRFEILDLGVRAGARAGRQAVSRTAGVGLGDRRGDPQRLGPLPAQLRHPAARATA